MAALMLLRLVCVLCLFLLASCRPLHGEQAVGAVWTFDNETWIENLAVRRSGTILCTSIDRAALYLVDPFAHTAVTVHRFSPSDRALGIAEVGEDVFAVASANVTLATSQSTPGSSKLWRVDMSSWERGRSDSVSLITNLPDVGEPDGLTALESAVVLLADTARGIIWRIDTSTGACSIAIQAADFIPPDGGIPLGVDGIHVHDGYLYFTNLGASMLGRVAIDPNGTATGTIEPWAKMFGPDDFTLATDGTVYAVGVNTLYRVSPQQNVTVIIGGMNHTVIEGATAAQFGRTPRDADVLYIATEGGMIQPVDGLIHGGQILAVNVRMV